MWLVLAQCLSLRIERRGDLGEMGEIGQPALRIRRGRRHDGQEPLGKRAHQPGGERRAARARQSTKPQRLAPSRETFGQLAHRRGAIERIQHRLQRHPRRLHPLARPTSATPAMSAAQSSGPAEVSARAGGECGVARFVERKQPGTLPELPCLHVGRPGEPGLSRIEVHADRSDGVTPSTQVVHARRGWLEQSAAFDPPLLLALAHVGHEVRQRHRISRSSLLE